MTLHMNRSKGSKTWLLLGGMLFGGLVLPWEIGFAQNLTYAPSSGLPVGRSPQALATGDFNGDGFWDLATVNGTSDDVSVLLGNGNGTFQSAVSFGVGKIPLALVASDMDHDGILDLVLALGGSDQVIVLKGDGEGRFAPVAKQRSGKGTHYIAVQDVNGDGWEDVIAVNSGRFGYYPPFNLSVLLNDGQGSLQEPVTYEDEGRDGMFPTGVAVEDLTGDGLPDLAVSWSQPSWRSPNGLVSILANRGEGAFAPFKELQPGFTLSAVQSADFDRDGLKDLVVTSLFTDTIRVVRQQEKGKFQLLEPVKVGFAPVGLAIQDFDGDGEVDLVVVNRDSNSLSVLLGEGNGTFHPAGHFGVGATPAAVVAQDFDQDQFPDLATADTNADSISVLLSGGGAIPQPSMSTDALVFEIEPGYRASAPSSPQQMVRVSNIGLGRLRVLHMDISGTEATAFSMTENTCADVTLHTGDSCTLQVVFTGKTQGPHHATLTIQDNGNGSPRQVALKGIVKESH